MGQEGDKGEKGELGLKGKEGQPGNSGLTGVRVSTHYAHIGFSKQTFIDFETPP